MYYKVRIVESDEMSLDRVDIYKAFNAHHDLVKLPFIPSVFGTGEDDLQLLAQLSLAFAKVGKHLDPDNLQPRSYEYDLEMTEHCIRFVHTNPAMRPSRIRNHFFWGLVIDSGAIACELSRLCLVAWLKARKAGFEKRVAA